MLRIDATEPVAIPDIHAWNVNLMEERFATTAEIAYITTTGRMKEGIRASPNIPCSTRSVPIFVPSLPKFCYATLDQLRYRTTHPENFEGKRGNRPSYHLRNLVRYLYLERQSQRELLLPLLAERNQAEMERRMNAC